MAPDSCTYHCQVSIDSKIVFTDRLGRQGAIKQSHSKAVFWLTV